MVWQAINKALYALKLVGIVYWAKQNVVAAWITGPGVCLYLGNKQRQEFVVYRLVHQDASCRGAVLTRVEESGNRNLRCGLL